MNPLFMDTGRMKTSHKRALSMAVVLTAYVLAELLFIEDAAISRIWPITTLALFLLYYNEKDWPLLLTSLALGTIVTTALFHNHDPWPAFLSGSVMAVVLTLVAYHTVCHLQRRMDIRHSFNSRKHVTDLFLAWSVLAMVLAVPRFLMAVLFNGNMALPELFLGTVLMELVGLMLFTPLLMLYQKASQGKVRLWNPGLLLVLSLLQVLAVFLVASSLAYLPFQSVFLLGMVILPFMIVSSYVEGFTGATVSILVAAFSLLFVLPSASNMVHWDTVTELITVNIYFLIMAVTTLVISAALSENREGLLSLNQRVAGNADLMLDLLAFQTEGLADKEVVKVLQVAETRIMAMNTVHGIVIRNLRESVDMEELFRELWQNIRKEEGQVQMEFDLQSGTLDFRDALYLALIFSELVHNSLMHAFPSGRGMITVQLRKEPELWKLLIADDGVGISQDSVQRSLGITLVKNLVQKQLGGDYRILEPPGTKWLIWFPRHIKHGN
ncbi:MAG: sensor histidine kinase [Candidatus Methanomethylophilaceae archaeon]|nr:sensor histidine kinase [Candidatus Methanomethylophilaceae archaeon]